MLRSALMTRTHHGFILAHIQPSEFARVPQLHPLLQLAPSTIRWRGSLVLVCDVVELNTPTAGQTFHVFVYEIAEDEVRYRYGLMGASVGQCLMSNIVRVVGPDEEGISI